MQSRRGPVYAIRTLAIGAILVLISSVGAQATDAIDDPVRQPHLKSWSNVIPNADRRFIVLADFNNAAVLDRETGLVWEKSPNANLYDWATTRSQCTSLTVGGRKAWRLPSIHELASLVDPSTPSESLRLPPGHPFINVQTESYWVATTDAADPTNKAWVEGFGSAVAGTDNKTDPKHVWCVRGPMNADAY